MSNYVTTSVTITKFKLDLFYFGQRPSNTLVIMFNAYFNKIITLVKHNYISIALLIVKIGIRLKQIYRESQVINSVLIFNNAV